MFNLVLVLVVLVGGMLLGYVWRNKKTVDLNKVVVGVIVVLIFSLGFSIGSNNELLAVMPRIGASALVMVTFILLFSVTFVLVAKRLVRL